MLNPKEDKYNVSYKQYGTMPFLLKQKEHKQ